MRLDDRPYFFREVDASLLHECICPATLLFLALRNTGQRDAHHVLVVGGAVFYGWHMECLLKEFSNDFICQSTHVVSAFRFRCEFKNRFMFGLCLFEGFA